MTTTVYGLTYCEDDGSREAWTWHYMPIEVFATAALRDKRIAALSKENQGYEFDTFDTPVVSESTEDETPELEPETDPEKSKTVDFFTALLNGD
jgi:hypothetical protein